MAERVAESGEKSSPRRRWLRRAAWIVGGAATIFVLVAFVLPTPLARYLISSQLDALGVAHEGVGTVDFDLWNSRFMAGPILMRGDDREPAELGAVDVTYSLANLVERRAFIETFALSGVNLVLRRTEDGAFSLNGISPPEPDPADVADEAEDAAEAGAEEAGPGFGYGVMTFVFTDSDLALEDFTGGRLTFDLERLELTGFRSWEPDAAGRYDLTATLNGAGVRAAGEATPFAETIRVVGDLAIDGLTLDGVAAFTGPTGLARQEGAHALDLRHDVRVSRAGDIVVALDGTARTEGIDLRTEAGDVVTMAALDKVFDAEATLKPDGDLEFRGDVKATLSDAEVAGSDGARVALDTATLTITDLDVAKRAELREGVAESLAPPADYGRAITLVEMVLRGMVSLVREALRHSIEGKAGVAVSAAGLEASAAGGARIALGDASAALDGLDISSTGPRWTMRTPLTATLSALEGAGVGGGARIESIVFEVGAFEGETDFIDRSLTFDAALSIEGVAAEPANGGRVGLDSLAVRSDRIALAGAFGAESLETALDAEFLGLDAATGGVAARAGAGRLALAAFELSQETGAAAFSGRIDVTDAAAEAGGASARAGALGLEMSGMTAETAPVFAISGAAALSAASVAVEQGAQGLSLSIGEAGAQADALQVSEGGATLAGAARASGLSLRMDGAAPLIVGLAGVRATGLDVSAPAGGAPAVAVETVTLEGLDAEVSVAAFGAEPSANGGAGEGSGGRGGGDAPPTVRLGRLSIAPGGRVAMLDSSAGEALRIPLTVERFDVGPVDTAAPATSTALDIALGIGDAARLDLSGAVTPLQPSPDFDLKADLAGFPLPLVSPYVTQLSGLTVESGALDVAATGRAAGGGLSGDVNLRLAEFYVGQPDEETAARFQKDYGVPVGFAVGVLKDSDGVIALSLPVSGTVAAPEIDYSDVINKAIGGALASLFPGGAFEGEAGFGVEPILFEPGAAELGEEAQAAAGSIASALGAKPDLRLRVCGKGARADLQALRGLDPASEAAPAPTTDEEAQALLALAQARGGALRAFLGAQGVAAERIGDCRTSYSVESDAPPRAEVQF